MEAYIYKKKKKKLSRKTKTRIFLFSLIGIIIILILYYFLIISPIVITLSEEKVRSLSTKVVSSAVGEVLTTEALTYDDLVNIEYDKNNDISLISTNSIEVNMFVRRVTAIVQTQMDSLGKQGVDIALGTFTGIPFLYGIGPMISVKLVPVGTVNTKFSSAFTSAGINQTLHRLYFVVSVNIGMVLPYMTKNIVTELEVEICESIIVGKIPEFYFQGKLI